MKGLWLESIPPEHRQMAVEALDTDNWCRFLHSASSNKDVLELVAFNGDASRERGVYEAVLLYAFMATSLNNRSWSTAELVDMFRRADPIKLRAAGDPLPGAGPFTVYRGVAGRGPAVGWFLGQEVLSASGEVDGPREGHALGRCRECERSRHLIATDRNRRAKGAAHTIRHRRGR